MKYKADSILLTDEIRSKEEGSFISLPSGNTHYKVEGDKGEWVVLVHGYATPYFIYDRVAKGLIENGYRVLRYDLLGRGLSERVKGKYDADLFVKQLNEITEIIIGDESFYLFGTSMGGIITTSFIAKYPKKVKKLVLLAPAGMRYDVPGYMKMSTVKGLGEIMFHTLGMKILTKNCASEIIYSGEEIRKEYTEKFMYCTQFKGMTAATLSSLRYTLMDFEKNEAGYKKTAESGVPVMVIWGTADKTMPYYQIDTMKKFLPEAEYVTYENSGHIFVYDEGERTVETVLPFLKK